jgi:putative peptidoglycan lipid II flippase
VVAGGALASAFIPTLSDYLAQDTKNDAWQLTSSVLTLLMIVLLTVSGLAAIFAPAVVNVLSPGFDPTKKVLTVSLLRVMLLTPMIFGIAGLMIGVLQAHQRFLLPAFALPIYNLGIIGGIVLLGPRIGIFGAAWGAVAGALAYMLLQVPGMFAVKFRYRLQADINDPGVREVARLMGPRVLGLAVIQVNFWVNTLLASRMVEGSYDAIVNAFYIMLLPQGVIAQSVANAVFPTFSAQVSSDDQEGLNRTLGQVLRAVMFLAIPAMVGLVMLRLPIVRILFERGEFTFTSSQAVAWALLFYGLGLASHSMVEILTRAFYAMHDTWTPVVIGGGAMVLNIILSLVLIQVIGEPGNLARGSFAGLALANTIATTLEAGIMLAVLGPRVGGYRTNRLFESMGKTAAASLVMGILLWGGLQVMGGSPQLLLEGVAGMWVGTLALVASGAATFWGVAWLMGSPEARLFTTFALSRLGFTHRETAAE